MINRIFLTLVCFLLCPFCYADLSCKIGQPEIIIGERVKAVHPYFKYSYYYPLTIVPKIKSGKCNLVVVLTGYANVILENMGAEVINKNTVRANYRLGHNYLNKDTKAILNFKISDRYYSGLIYVPVKIEHILKSNI